MEAKRKWAVDDGHVKVTRHKAPAKFKDWISAFRLRTLPLSLSVILVGNSVAFEYKKSSGKVFWLCLLTTLFLQVLSNLANDYGDAIKGADNSGRIGPKRAIQSGKISKTAMLRAIIITAVLSLASGIYLLISAFGSTFNWPIISFLILGLLCIAAAIKYTVGKKAYGYSGMGDLFVFIFFGLVGVLGPYYLQTKTFDVNALLLAITMGCFSVAVLNLNNMRDHLNDKAVGKNTLVVKIGLENAKIYHYSLFGLAYLCLIMFIASQIVVFFVVLFFLAPIIVFNIIHLAKVSKTRHPKDFDPELKKVALQTMFFAIILSFCLIIF